MKSGPGSRDMESTTRRRKWNANDVKDGDVEVTARLVFLWGESSQPYDNELATHASLTAVVSLLFNSGNSHVVGVLRTFLYV